MRFLQIATLVSFTLLFTAFFADALSISINNNRVSIDGVRYEAEGSSPLTAELPGRLIIDGGVTDIDITGADITKCELELTWYEYKEGDASFYIDSNGELKSRTHSGKPAALKSVRGRIPNNVDLNLDTGSGDVSLSGMQNARTIVIDTGSGEIYVENISGAEELTLDSGSGDQEANDIHEVTDFTLDVGSGEIRVNIAENIGRMIVDTGSGDVQMRSVIAGVIEADSGSGDITFNNLNCVKLAADTGSGDVNLIDSEVKQLEADTGSGDVNLKYSSVGNRNIDTGTGDVNETNDALK